MIKTFMIDVRGFSESIAERVDKEIAAWIEEVGGEFNVTINSMDVAIGPDVLTITLQTDGYGSGSLPM